MNRIALVIGNSDYLNGNKLNNPKNDANDIESVLHKLDFEVTKVMDAKLIDIQQAVNTFLQELDEYAVGLLFYAGHGMQIDGKNYILPVDLELSDKSKTIVSCYCLDTFLEGVSSYKGKTIICILDACRNNPFAMSRGLSTGFSPLNPPKGTIIAYSTSVDCSAFDGQSSNGLYTQVLKDSMLIPNLKIEEMFKSVRNKVSEISISQYNEEQISWEYSSLVGDFYFSVTPQPVNVNVTDDEIYEFICTRQKFYESTNNNNIYDIECLPYVDAYNKYRIPIIKILRAYSRIDYQKQGYQFSDATIDQLNINYLSSWGFKQKYDRWYYKNHYVEMGDLLPLPEELEPKKPIEGKELKVEASLSCEFKDGKISFAVLSNIPTGTPMIFTLKGKNYTAQSNAVVDKHILISEWFSNQGKPIKNGFYTIEVSCPIDRVLPDNIKEIFGERSRNICGPYVKFEPIGGNTIHFSYGLSIKNDAVQVIDMQQRISEL